MNPLKKLSLLETGDQIIVSTKSERMSFEILKSPQTFVVAMRKGDLVRPIEELLTNLVNTMK